jgi:hypothetical protein
MAEEGPEGVGGSAQAILLLAGASVLTFAAYIVSLIVRALRCARPAMRRWRGRIRCVIDPRRPRNPQSSPPPAPPAAWLLQGRPAAATSQAEEQVSRLHGLGVVQCLG